MTELWDDSDYSLETYVAPPPDDDLVASIERELGVRLPASYVALAHEHNGGVLARNCHRTPTPTTWADDHVAVHALSAISRELDTGVAGAMGSRFMITEWGYPDLGVYIGDCPSAGHDMIALDYRAGGEPLVVHVDEELDYRVTVLARSFSDFLTELVTEDAFPIR